MINPTDKSYNNEEYPPTNILRANPGMIRDCFYGKDGYLIIRQVKFKDINDISQSAFKEIRLSPLEVKSLIKFVKDNPCPIVEDHPGKVILPPK